MLKNKILYFKLKIYKRGSKFYLLPFILMKNRQFITLIIFGLLLLFIYGAQGWIVIKHTIVLENSKDVYTHDKTFNISIDK